MNINTVKKLLANHDKNEWYNIIASLSSYSEETEEWLLDYCSNTYSEDDAYDALDKIDELVKKNRISWECRRNIVDNMLEQFDKTVSASVP